MPKYYVQCGPIEIVLNADSIHDAAMSVIDRSMTPHLWIYDDPGLSSFDRCRHLMIEALLHLDPTIRISERGFDNYDAFTVDTPETVSQWHALMTGMAKLFVHAGLAPRSLEELSAKPPQDSAESRRRPR